MWLVKFISTVNILLDQLLACGTRLVKNYPHRCINGTPTQKLLFYKSFLNQLGACMDKLFSDTIAHLIRNRVNTK